MITQKTLTLKARSRGFHLITQEIISVFELPEKGLLNNYRHIFEGADDLPAHIKTSLTQVSISIPIVNYRLALGTWQGVYLCEFRNYGGSRKLLLSLYE
ncbi:MAG: secondary thiamine-phosphate synthase [Bacteroidetes bacterium 4572_77]|nr:MAG: secondary thiamine-phosphate synthase [Bacteroidetes bacterium 4572_77]